MKTIVFHSYKGGVGRTLALANLGIALSKIGKRVLMLDMDFDAPGLAFKWNVENQVKKGYVDYLDACARNYANVEHADLGDREEYLEHSIIDIKENLYLLPAGDSSCSQYWQKLASSYFRHFFTYHEDSNEGKAAKQSIQNFFQDDLSMFSHIKQDIDYLLVDCKGGTGYISAPPILQWSDHVVELFSMNEEGVFGDLLIRKSLKTLDENFSREVELTSVVSRVPEVVKDKQALQEYIKIKQSIQEGDNETVESPSKLKLLHEQQELEFTGGLLLARGYIKSSDVTLSHDYIELFETIFKEDDDIVTAISSQGSDSWKTAVNLAQSVGTIDRFFKLEMGRGELLNEDGEPNVSLRTETLGMILATIADHQSAYVSDEIIEGVFEHAGRLVGDSFGSELMEPNKVWLDGIPEKIVDRLSGWCAFDRRAGFGYWESDYSSDGCGTIKMHTHFLAKFQARANTKAEFIAAFLKGYITSIMEHLFSDQQKKLDSVSINRVSKDGSLVFIFITK